jgi:plasmid stabilization system protein ParE
MIVRWTKLAAANLAHICDYSENRFGAAQAKRAALSIYAAGSLKEMPNRGRVGRKPGTREITVGRLPFVIVYRVQKEAVQILRILHDSQQWP